MIELRLLNGQSLDLFPTTKITFVKKNPFFLDERLYISIRTQNFSLPRTDKNDKALKLFSVPSAFYRDVSIIYVDVMVEGNLFMKGELSILRSPEDSYNVNITRRYIDFQSDLRLREIPLPSPGTSDSETRTNDFGKTFPEVPCVYPMYQNIREFGLGIKPEHDNDISQPMRPANWNGGSLEVASDKDLAVPMFFLPWAIKEVVKASGNLHAGGIFLEDEEIQDKVIFNTTCTNEGESVTLGKLHLPTDSHYASKRARIYVSHINFDPTTSSAQSIRNNQWYSADWFEFEVGTKISFTVFEIHETTGAIVNTTLVEYLTTTFDTGQNALLVNIAATFLATVPNADVLAYGGADTQRVQVVLIGLTNSNRISIVGTKDLDPTTFSKNYCTVNFAGSFSYAAIRPEMHLPDVTVSEFFKWIADFYNLTIYLADTRDELVFVQKAKALSSKRADVSKYLLTGADKEEKMAMYLWLEFENDPNDKKVEGRRIHANNYPEHTKSPLTTITCKCATLAPIEQIVNHVSSAFGPVITWTHADVPIVEMEFGTYSDPKPFSLRLLKYLGVQDDTGGYAFLASDIEGLTPNEMYTYWFKDWYQIIKHPGRFFWMNFDFDIDFLLNIKPEESWQILDNAYIWEEIQTTITMDSIEYSNVKLLKL